MKTYYRLQLVLAAFALSFPGSMMAELAPKSGIEAVAQQSGRITGTVMDELGPVIGAAVEVKGTHNGVVTDSDGHFTLSGLKKGAIIRITYLGYVAQEIPYTGQATLDVTLVEDSQALGEVVVTALGIAKESKKLGYSVTTIKSDDLIKAGTPNFATALYGKASGVRIQNTQGGAAGGVSITVRGLSSINGNTQPLVILNGVPIRNGNSGTGSSNSSDFSNIGLGSTQMGSVRSNGLTDINPEDIDQLTILKGAAATALYGSEAANGAIIITSKKAKGAGVTVDVNATFQANMVAYVPEIQTTYGPGTGNADWTADMIANGGFRKDAATGKLYPAYNSYQWGPAYDGREVLYIDGSTRAYSPISSNPWKQLFRTGTDQTYNIAINQGSENSSNRFSYTTLLETPTALTGSYSKHNFSLVGNLKFNDKLSLDYTANYISQHVVNRAQASIGMYGGFDNMFGAFLDIPLMKQMYKTSLGYRNDDKGSGPTPDEAFKYGSDGSFTKGVREILWDTNEHESDELEQRLIASVAPTWKIFPFLTAKGRLSTDYTSSKMTDKSNTTFPSAASTSESSGSYSTLSKFYQVTYGDIMLMFDKRLNDKFNLTAAVGWQARSEKMNSLQVGTNGGLMIENTFMIGNSYKTINISNDNERNMELLKTAWLETIGLSYNDFLFLDLTGRQEKSSTLPKNSRSYFYPSGSLSFLYTDAFRDNMPSWYSYGKLRASYGIVGNAPEAYAANMAYTFGSGPGWSYNQVPNNLGNENLKPEKTKEFEIGIENKFFNNRAGFEVSYYNKKITDMLLKTALAPSSGSETMWVNSGVMSNKGIEISAYGTPIETKDFSLELKTNLGFNKNKIESLVEGINFIETGDFASKVGKNYSYVGRPMGDFLAAVNQTVEDGPYKGRNIVNADGNYVMSQDYEFVGNAMPKVVGGLGITVAYKRFVLDVMTDFRFGGYIANDCYRYTMATGVNPETEHREGEGFLPYTYNNGLTAQTGIILDGVVSDGNGGWKENDKAIAYEDYIQSKNAWGTAPGVPNGTYQFFKNNWWKLREVALSYNFSKDLIKHAAIKNLTLSVFGRNLFYFHKSIPNFDPETSNGTDWKSQLSIGGSASPTRSVGVSLRATF